MKRTYRWHSPNLGHEMNLSIFGHAGMRVLMFPIRITSYAMYEKHGIVGALEDLWSKGHLQLYCIDAIDDYSYDFNRRLEAFNAQEKYIFEELLPLSEHLNPGTDIATFGICLGGFHAVDLAFRNLGRFSRAVAFSSRFDLTRDSPGHQALLSRGTGPGAYRHTPTAYLPELADQLSQHDIRVALGVGRQDPFLTSNLELHRILRASGVPVDLHLWDGPSRRGSSWRTLAAHCFAPVSS